MTGRAAALGHTLALGAVSWVYSEALFWGQWRRDDDVAGVVLTWLVYSVISYIAVAAARAGGVSTLGGLFLVGSLFGWLAEGAIAGTTLQGPPLQIAWTALAWHAPLTVCLGWYAMPAVLRGARLGRRVLAVTVLGLAFGTWAAGFVHEPDGNGVPTLTAFSAYAVALAAVLAVAYVVRDRWAPADPTPVSRPVVRVAVGLTLAWFLTAVVPAQPWALIGLPALLAIPLLALSRGRAADRTTNQGSRPVLLARPDHPMRYRDVAPLALLPPRLRGARADGRQVPVMVAYVVTVPLGVIALVVSVVRVARARRVRVERV
jgi:hypothetical protein